MPNSISINDIIKVADNYFGIVLDVFENGYMTTAGFVLKEHAEKHEGVMSISYDSDHADQLPVEWPDMLWLDDNGNRQKIKEIRWDLDERGPVYVMSDGTRSEVVTC